MNALSFIERLLQAPAGEIKTPEILLALAVSAAAAWLAAIAYRAFYENRATGSQIDRSFLLIGPATTALFIAIQSSLPLSLGLVGALTIVRFRTPIKEPEEIGFLMVVIAASIACATFQWILLGALFALTLAVLLLQRLVPGLARAKASDGVLLLVLDGETADDVRRAVIAAIEGKLTRARLQSISFAEGVTTLHYSFTRMRAEDLQELRTTIGKIAAVRKLTVFFNGQGALP
jgi:hypothetical protein